MSTKINVETFVAVLRKSGLVDRDRLETFLRDELTNYLPTDDAGPLSERFISENLITRWQSDKLMQGKHRGYFLGKYKLLSLVGKGGMSSVYLAEHLLLRRRCALKVLPARRVDDSSYLERFHREAQAVASLDHPNIVRAYDVDHQTDGDRQIHFLVMEFVDGQSLQELVSEKGVLSFLDAAEYARQAALGLKQAHEQGMIHRDIKPGNLLVDQNGVVKILDLGLAKFFKVEEGNEALTIRHDEKVLGTADYLAPEQALDSHTVDVRADIYSLGCTLYFLVTGQPPFTEGTLAQRLMAHQVKTPPTVESLRPETPVSLAIIIRKMMEKQLADRFQSAAELERSLYTWIDDNADDQWRRLHSEIYGSRTSDSGSARKAIPIAQPIVLKSGAPAIVEPIERPISKPSSSRSLIPKSVSRPQPVEAETAIDPIFSNLTQAPIGAADRPTEPAPLVATPLEFTLQDAVMAPTADPLEAPLFNDTETPFPVDPSPFSNLESVAPKSPSTVKSTKASSTRTRAGKARPSFDLAWMAKLKGLTGLQWGGIGAAAAVVLIGFVYVAGGFGGTLSNRSGKQATQQLFPREKREVTVGAKNAEYATIRDALNAVRDQFRPRKDITEPFLIKIAPGTYRETIHLDGRTNRWPEGVAILGDGEVHLEAIADEPVIRLANVSRLAIENIQVDAKEHKIAVELAGDLHESRLGKLVIRSFSEVGILCKGARGLSFGSNQLLLDQITFEPSTVTACGVRLVESAENSAESIIVTGCRFLGPMAAGIEILDPSPYGIDVQESIFNKTTDGIRFGNQPLLKSINIVNNSFRQTRHGIRFDKLPKDQSTGLSFRRNLFVATEHGECVVQRGYDDGKLRGMLLTTRPAVQNNWTDRAKPATPYDDEVVFFFDDGGRQGEANFAFASIDPQSRKFLAPTESSPQKRVDGAQPPDREWVGAVGP